MCHNKYSQPNNLKILLFRVPQGSILWPMLFLIYIHNIRNCTDISMTSFAMIQMICRTKSWLDSTLMRIWIWGLLISWIQNLTWKNHCDERRTKLVRSVFCNGTKAHILFLDILRTLWFTLIYSLIISWFNCLGKQLLYQKSY
jgi:hypothetical protein